MSASSHTSDARIFLDPLKALVRHIDTSLVAPGAPGPLAMVRMGLSLIIMLRLMTHQWALVADRPAELTYQLWTLGWLPHLPPWALITIQLIGLIGVALVIIRRIPRVGFALAWASLLILAGLWGASGKFQHNDVLLLTASFPILFTQATPRRSTLRPSLSSHKGPREIAWGWPPRAALVLVACVYFLTGVQKLRHSGLEWVFSDNMSWVLRQGAGSSPFGTDFALFLANTPLLPQLLAGGALALELTAPLMLFWRPTRLVFAAAVTAMHISIWACLGLDYSAWWLTVWVITVATGLPTGWGGKRATARRATATDNQTDNATQPVLT